MYLEENVFPPVSFINKALLGYQFISMAVNVSVEHLQRSTLKSCFWYAVSFTDRFLFERKLLVAFQVSGIAYPRLCLLVSLFPAEGTVASITDTKSWTLFIGSAGWVR